MSNEKVLTEEIKLQRRCSGLCWCCNEKKELLQKLELYKNERDYKSERNGVNCIERDQLREKLRVAVDALKFYGNEDHWSNKQSVMESHGSLPKIANKVVNKDLSLPRGGEGYWFKVAGKKAREALAKIGDVG